MLNCLTGDSLCVFRRDEVVKLFDTSFEGLSDDLDLE